MNYHTVEDVIALQELVIARSGGRAGILNRGAIESAVAQPLSSFGGVELYPTLAEKAAALGYSLARNHGFADGNKRIAHAVLESFLTNNGYELIGTTDEQEAIFLQLAAGTLSRIDLLLWLADHIQIKPAPTP